MRLRTRIRFHDFSGSWEHKWDLDVVSKHLGHSSAAVTEARYAHTTPEALRRNAHATVAKNLPQRFPTNRLNYRKHWLRR